VNKYQEKMQAVKDKFQEMNALRKAKAELKAEEKVMLVSSLYIPSFKNMKLMRIFSLSLISMHTINVKISYT
jgi:hypothetical protein